MMCVFASLVVSLLLVPLVLACSPAVAEDSSGQGVTRIYYDAQGTALPAPLRLLKPDICAPDATGTLCCYVMLYKATLKLCVTEVQNFLYLNTLELLPALHTMPNPCLVRDSCSHHMTVVVVAAAAAAAAAADTSFFGADMLPDSDLDGNGLPNFQGNIGEYDTGVVI
jgi:hypothetical protein